MLRVKQGENNERFLRTEAEIRSIISFGSINNLIDATVEDIKKNLKGGYGLAWSGGKDSVVLDFVCKKVGNYPSCIGMTDELEYPEFLRFVTENMPSDLVVYNSGHTLKWLSENESWLFPKTGEQAAKWFKAVQHNAQNKFYSDKRLDLILTGRRILDKNFCGTNGKYLNKSTGVVRYSPLYKWTHEEILACMSYYNLPRAPFYSWPNGFIVGSGSWAARQWTGSVEAAWSEVYSIDSTVVLKASEYIKSAKDYVRTLGV